MTLIRRSVVSSVWSVAANGLYLGVSLLRSILLARWLPIEVFGAYAAARAFVEVTAVLPGLGMDGAFLHRAREVEDEQSAAAVHFTLKLLFTFIWTLGLLAYSGLTPSRIDPVALTLILATTAVSHLTQTPSLILARRVVYRRLALVQVINGIVSLAIGLYLGLRFLQTRQVDFALWALLSTHVVTTSANVLLLYVWRPVWRPRLKWDKETVRYYVTFGGKNFLSAMLLQLLDRLDDLWTKFYIGDRSLGFYSRAYTFATYPREFIARPINQVTSGTYAALKNQRKELSQAFFRVNAFLIRTGFYFGGLLFWIAPEFIHLVLTDKWLPMLWVFRLMLVFTLLDPLKMAVSRLMVGVGDVTRPLPARLLQLLVLIVGLYTFGPAWGVEGVAIAVNVMLLVGIIVLFHQVRDYVDVSLKKLFLVPSFALVCALLATGLVLFGLATLPLGWWGLFLKSGVYTAVYGFILFGLEWRQTMRLLQWRHYLNSQTDEVNNDA